MIMNKPDMGNLSYYYVDRFISSYWYDWIILLIPGWAGWFERRLISCLLYTVHCTLYVNCTAAVVTSSQWSAAAQPCRD